jgi:hypothetical protein
MGDFVREFLFGSKGITRDEAGVRAEIQTDLRTEGWIGIPHGGISMGAVMDLYESLREASGPAGLPFPLALDIRMGGSRLRTGETVSVAVTPEGDSARGVVSLPGNDLPYLEADITPGVRQEPPGPPLFLPPSFDRLERSLSPMPYYRNCFVCGVDRSHPGLKRTFHLFEAQSRVVVCSAGFDAADRSVTAAEIALRAALTAGKRDSDEWSLPSPQYPEYFHIAINDSVARSLKLRLHTAQYLSQSLIQHEQAETWRAQN